MHFYERMKQKFVYIYLFVLARRFYRFLKNLPNVGYDILERGYRYIDTVIKTFNSSLLKMSGRNRVETGYHPIRVLPGSIRFLSGL